MKQTHHGSRPVALLLACGACTTLPHRHLHGQSTDTAFRLRYEFKTRLYSYSYFVCGLQGAHGAAVTCDAAA